MPTLHSDSSTRRPSTAEVLRTSIPRIQRLWVARMHESIGPAAALPEPLLINTLPDIVEKIAVAVAGGPGSDVSTNTNIPAEHGEQRARLTDFSIEQVVLEYQLLRDAVYAVIEEVTGALPPLRETRIILWFFDRMVRDAASAFAAVQRQQGELFAMTLSHDLRNPLSAARLAVDVVLRYPEQHEQRSERLTRARDNIDRVDQMIQDLLDASQLRSGHLPQPTLAECRPMELVAQSVEGMRALHGDRFGLSGDSGVDARWDVRAVQRAVENLLGNAIKHGSPTEPVTIHVREHNGLVAIAVHNEGSYIRAENIERLFIAYARARDARRRRPLGWGPGLTLVKGVASAHGGSVIVESSEVGGTTFTLTLPRDPAVIMPQPV